MAQVRKTVRTSREQQIELRPFTALDAESRNQLWFSRLNATMRGSAVMWRAGSWLICASLGLIFMSESFSARADDVITLGAAVSMTGKYAQNGTNTRNGYDLAVKKINEKGGISISGKPYLLIIRYYDDESTPARGMELAERLIKQDRVKFMLGPYSSGLTKAILPVIEKYGVPMVDCPSSNALRQLVS